MQARRTPLPADTLSRAGPRDRSYGQAAFCLEELLLQDPHNPHRLFKLASILYTRGGAENLAAANKYLCRAVEVAEPNAHLLWGLLNVRVDQGESEGEGEGEGARQGRGQGASTHDGVVCRVLTRTRIPPFAFFRPVLGHAVADGTQDVVGLCRRCNAAQPGAARGRPSHPSLHKGGCARAHHGRRPRRRRSGSRHLKTSVHKKGC